MIMHSHWYKSLIILILAFSVFGMASFSYAQYPGFDAPGTTGSSAGVGLTAVQSSIDGGSVPAGGSSQVVVLFRNEGGQPVITGEIKLYPSSNVSASVALNQCGAEALPSGGECAVAISVKGLQAGPWRLEMLMLHNGRNRLVTSTLSGSVEPSNNASDQISSEIEIIPSALDFGALGSSHTLVESVIMRNITSEPLEISDIIINSTDRAGFSVESECKELRPGQACIATVRWAPAQKGPSTGFMVIKHTGASALLSLPLSGDYDPDNINAAEIFPEAVPGRGLLVSSQKDVNFGNAVASASTITVSLVNTGDTPLQIKDLRLAGSDNGLSLGLEGCVKDLVLQPVEACPLTVTWAPTRIGDIVDDIQIKHDGARGILVLPVRGVASAVASQSQRAIVMDQQPTRVIDNENILSNGPEPAPVQANRNVRQENSEQSIEVPIVANAAATLDGLKITSFSSNRAIVNGPGGSRLLYDSEDIILGGVLWGVAIKKNGIEFTQGQDRVLLLFDRSLSPANNADVSSSSVNQNTSQSTEEEELN